LQKGYFIFFPVTIEFQLLRVFCLNLLNNFKGKEMKKVKIAIIGAGSEEIGQAIKHHILLKECATVIINKPMGNGKTEGVTPQRKFSYSGTFEKISQKTIKALEDLCEATEEGGKAIQEVTQQSFKAKKVYEKPRSKYHK
jgi:hypothetical protein